MSPPTPPDPDLKALSDEIRHLHRQVAALHQQGFVMMRMLSAMLSRLTELSAQEGALERGVGAIEKEIAQLAANPTAAGLCPLCGGPLDRHAAASGQLRVCTACGFSQFVDEHGVVRSTAQPMPPPPAGEVGHSWVD